MTSLTFGNSIKIDSFLVRPKVYPFSWHPSSRAYTRWVCVHLLREGVRASIVMMGGQPPWDIDRKIRAKFKNEKILKNLPIQPMHPLRDGFVACRSEEETLSASWLHPNKWDWRFLDFGLRFHREDEIVWERKRVFDYERWENKGEAYGFCREKRELRN